MISDITCCVVQIWVHSPHNGSGYYSLGQETNDQLSVDHFQATLASDPSTMYARTGYLGFIKKSDKTAPDGSECCHCCFHINNVSSSIL